MSSATLEATDVLQDLRKKIDALDEALVRLLNARAACALEIGREKARRGLPIYEPEREAAVLAHILQSNSGPLEAEALRRLFERVVDEARRMERNPA